MRPEGSVQPHPQPIEHPRTVSVLDVPLALTDYVQTLDWIDAMIAEQERGFVCVCNVHTVMASSEDPELRRRADRVLVQRARTASRSCGRSTRSATTSPARVYGPELMAQACAQAALRGHRFYLYGGRNQGALVQLALNLRQRYPGVRIVGGYSPPHRPLSRGGAVAVADEINRARADVVWVGIGVPKQEKWMALMRPRLDAPLLVGVGAAFDFHAGLVPQAPELAPGGRARVGLPARTRAASPVAALPPVQPALRRRVRASARRQRRRAERSDRRRGRARRRHAPATITAVPAPAHRHRRRPHARSARLSRRHARVGHAAGRAPRAPRSLVVATAPTRDSAAVAERHGARLVDPADARGANAARNAAVAADAIATARVHR